MGFPFTKKKKSKEQTEPAGESAAVDATRTTTADDAKTTASATTTDKPATVTSTATPVLTNTETVKPVATATNAAAVEPVTAKPPMEKPVTTKAAAAKPPMAKPVTTKAATAKAATIKPATTKAATTKPVTVKPITVKPITAKTPPRNAKSKKNDAAGTGSTGRRRGFFGKPSPMRKRAPGTAETETVTPLSILASVNVKHAMSSGGENDFEVFMGDYPEEVLEEREMIRKQLFGEEEDADADAKDTTVDKKAESSSSVENTATTNSQEVFPGGKVQDTDDVLVEEARAAEAKKVPEVMPKIQRVRSAAEIAAVAEAIANATNPYGRARGPATPVVEGKPFDEAAEYNKDEVAEMERFSMKETERKMEQDHLSNQETWSTADSSARDTYDPSLASSFRRMNNSLMASPGNGQHASGSQNTTARQIMDALGCGVTGDFSVSNLFNDTANACSSAAQSSKPENRRPYFNEKFAKLFLQKLMTKGIRVLHLQPPGVSGNDSFDWKGRTVSLMIEPGMPGSDSAIQPKLEWSTLAGGQNFEVDTSSLALLRILSISGSAQEMKEEGDDDRELCFFTVTTDTGDVHIFEASSPGERDQIVNGLKNVIARLAFHVIAGDTTASSELYNEDAKSKSHNAPVGDLPSLASPHQNMNRIAHTLLV